MAKFYKVILILNLLLNQVAFADGSQSLTDIDEVASHFVYDSLREHHGEQGDYSVNIGHLDQRLNLEQCTQALNPSIEYGQLSQNNFTVKISCSSPKKWAVRIPVKVQVFKQVVITTQHISKDMPINGAELKLQRQDVSQIGDAFYESIDDLTGLVAQKNIASGSVLKHHMVKQPTLVYRGQMVKMVIEAPGLTIEGTGIAQNDGIKGQLVKVKNVRSNRVVDAMVVDAGITVIPM
jgi:flagella basal body P-ring formation protein FlgA